MYWMCSSGRRGLMVWSWRPESGTPKYVSKWRWWFQQNVPTRASSSMPAASSAFARRATRSPYSE